MNDEKVLMAQAATLYYQQNKTQQEIAQILHLTRQTVSRLLGDAIREKVVEIIIHDPKSDCENQGKQICDAFGITDCVVCGVSGDDAGVHRLMTVRAAVEHLMPIIRAGDLKIAVSWGRTVQELIRNFPEITTKGNTVFPLFGATDNENAYFSSNELARKLADKLSADIKCAWFPYLTEEDAEYKILKELSYFKKMQEMWDSADLAILGIGNTEILDIFGKTFGYSDIHAQAIGDIATHFFNEKGQFIDLYENTLCASVENLKNAKRVVAVASGKNKAAAIAGALRTGLIHTLITDQVTARSVLELA